MYEAVNRGKTLDWQACAQLEATLAANWSTSVDAQQLRESQASIKNTAKTMDLMVNCRMTN